MGEDQRREAAEKEAATRRATDAQVLEDVERLIAAWNERQHERRSSGKMRASSVVLGGCGQSCAERAEPRSSHRVGPASVFFPETPERALANRLFLRADVNAAI